MVMMISVTTDASRAGSTGFSLQQDADQRCGSNGKNYRKRQRQAASKKAAVAMPPIITNSPWAKLMTWLAL